MQCRTEALPGGGTVFICGLRRETAKRAPVLICAGCGEPGATLLCDWPVPDKRIGRAPWSMPLPDDVTCTQPIHNTRRCAVNVNGKDYCKSHVASREAVS